jgi:outer membrane biosynthesis protein TonB
MAVAQAPRWSLRQEQAEISRLTWAFIISIALHILIFGGYFAGQKLGIWQNLQWPSWLQPVQRLTERLKKAPELPKPPQEAPLMFVQVDPAQATTEPPKDAKFYSGLNAKAANPDATEITDAPKVTGNQTQVIRTEDVPPDKPMPLQPSRPAPLAKEEQKEEKAKPPEPKTDLAQAQVPGDLALAKPSEAPAPKQDEGEQKQSRPRTLKEARARRQLVGEKMKQEGGVQRRGAVSFDTRATPYGEYDDALIQAVQERWYRLLEQRDYASDSRGRVVLTFVLHYDGRVSDMSISENTAGEVLGLICRKAVEDNSPYAAWPSDMRRMLGETRKIQFTFYYN